ncbi:MAG: magnesium/cobalt transporter CorA [Bacteroidota bacterium]
MKLTDKVNYKTLKSLNPLNPILGGMKKRPKTGLAPGSIIYTGEIYSENILIEIIDYTDEQIHEINIIDPDELAHYRHNQSVTWINIQGLHDTNMISKIGDMLGIHPLTLEDVVDTGQRPKMEIYDDYLYITLKMINYHKELKKIEIEQAGIIIHENYVICFQEKPGDIFDSIRKRLRDGNGRARKRGSDYLAYMILDLIIDYYYETLDEIWNRIEFLDDQVVRRPDRVELRDIQQLKRDLLQLRRHIYPVRDALTSLENKESEVFTENTLVYLRDTIDHVKQVVESIDTYRETLSNIMDIYLSQLSIKMNEVMKVLTIIATIFIPLTFIAGVYGMNFKHMPELDWEYAYPEGFYILIGVVSIVMFIYIKTKRWL